VSKQPQAGTIRHAVIAIGLDLAKSIFHVHGIDVITTTALSTTIVDPSVFLSGRQFAAFLGLVHAKAPPAARIGLVASPRLGDGYLRKLLVVGATSVIRRARTGTLAAAPWIRSLLERRPARIAWAVLTRSEVYRAPAMA
jgi:transposase